MNKRMQRTSTRFLLEVFLQNEAEICEKKIQGNVFLLHQKPHAKFQLIWMTFKKMAKIVTYALFPRSPSIIFIQRTKKVVSTSPGLVDFAIGLVDSDHHLPDGQVKFVCKTKQSTFHLGVWIFSGTAQF